MSAMPKTIITDTYQIHELTAVFNNKIGRLEERIEVLEQDLEIAHSRIRELEIELAAAASRCA